jgi:DNA-binding LacI/PurR family transcriptional regulator
MTQGRAGGRRAAPGQSGKLPIGVIAPLVGGFYFGSIVAGVTRAATNAGRRVIAEQTFPGRPGRERHPGEPLPGGPWTLHGIDGAVIITRAMSSYRLDQLLDSDFPVVLVGADDVGERAPIVSPDNAGGTRITVDHLIEHGHTRIGFAGDLSQRDIRERFDAYRDALRTHGIQAQRDWFFEAAGNHEPGGAEAAERFLVAGLPTTATIAATDRNALGFIQALRAADVVVPRDHAVIGFDHTEGGARSAPRLSAVDPHHDRAGELAADLLLSKLAGDDVPAKVHRIPTTLVVRESCGCSKVTTIGRPPRSAGGPCTSRCSTAGAASFSTRLTSPPSEGARRLRSTSPG